MRLLALCPNPQPEGTGHLILRVSSPRYFAFTIPTESDLPLDFLSGFRPTLLSLEYSLLRKAAVLSKSPESGLPLPPFMPYCNLGFLFRHICRWRLHRNLARCPRANWAKVFSRCYSSIIPHFIPACDRLSLTSQTGPRLAGLWTKVNV